MSESSVALELFLRWLNEAHERRFSLTEAVGAHAQSVDGDIRLAVEVRPLLGDVEDPGWRAARTRLETFLSDDLPGAYALWVPFGAALPADEPALSDFIDAVRQAALKLGPHERSYVPLPARMTLRQTSDAGGVVSVTGGLNQHWARFTELVRGTYDLDSTAVHRLPESDAHLEELVGQVVEATKQLSAGQAADIETIDAWTLQRLLGDSGVKVVGAPATQTDDPGLTVRRNTRRILSEATETLRSAEADGRALVLLGHYPRMEKEGATTAMRGYDPSLYSGIDFVCLVADGLVKPIIDSPVAVKPTA